MFTQAPVPSKTSVYQNETKDMSTSDWQAIPKRLHVAGFTVFYVRIPYESVHHLWCANAHRDGQVWSGVGRDFRTALAELEKNMEDTTGTEHAQLLQEARGTAATKFCLK
jgi:hypothetical protein